MVEALAAGVFEAKSKWRASTDCQSESVSIQTYIDWKFYVWPPPTGLTKSITLDPGYRLK